MEEEWRPCFRYEGIYVVSNHGRIARIYADGSMTFMKTERLDKNGYQVVTLKDRGRSNAVRICKMVAMAFLGAGAKWYVRHLDGNLLNNRTDNLEVNEFKFMISDGVLPCDDHTV